MLFIFLLEFARASLSLSGCHFPSMAHEDVCLGLLVDSPPPPRGFVLVMVSCTQAELEGEAARNKLRLTALRSLAQVCLQWTACALESSSLCAGCVGSTASRRCSCVIMCVCSRSPSLAYGVLIGLNRSWSWCPVLAVSPASGEYRL